MSTVYVVGRPAADPEELTLRAGRILRAVALVAAEDAEEARRFLDGCTIGTPVVPLSDGQALRRALETGDVAFLASPSSPGIATPACEILGAAIAQGHALVPIPGPSVPLTAVLLSGLPASTCLNLGELPAAAEERDAALQAVAAEPHTLVLRANGRDLPGLLAGLKAVLGERPVSIVPEETLAASAIWRGTPAEALEQGGVFPAAGYYQLVVGGASAGAERWDEARLRAEIGARLAAGASVAGVSRDLAGPSGWSRREIYRLALEAARFPARGQVW